MSRYQSYQLLALSNNVLKSVFSFLLLKAEVSDILGRDNHLIYLSIFIIEDQLAAGCEQKERTECELIRKGGGPYPVKVSLLPNHSHKAR